MALSTVCLDISFNDWLSASVHCDSKNAQIRLAFILLLGVAGLACVSRYVVLVHEPPLFK